MGVRSYLRFSAPLSAVLLGACVPSQSSIHPSSPIAEKLASLFWIFTIVLGCIWVAVLIATAAAAIRSRSENASSTQETTTAKIIVSLSFTTALIVFGLTAVSMTAQNRLTPSDSAAVTIKLVGHQWWWEAQYEDPVPSRMFTTANELHIPINTPVRIKLESHDVVHSFWVPSLNGKTDLIPGKDNETELFASTPGVYRGQCAEFCGKQHAHMSFLIVAEEQQIFNEWKEHQAASANEPQSAETQSGKAVFMVRCLACHRIGGTQAGGRFGPDLTHFGSRKTFAAVAGPADHQRLLAWVADPQKFKPGTQMPRVPLSPAELTNVVSYIENLK